MFGHYDIGPDVKSVNLTCTLDTIDKPLSALIFAQKYLPAEAGKGQGMGIARIVKAFHRFAMIHSECRELVFNLNKHYGKVAVTAIGGTVVE